MPLPQRKGNGRSDSSPRVEVNWGKASGPQRASTTLTLLCDSHTHPCVEIEFDPDKDIGNLAKHGASLAHGVQIFEDPDVLIASTIREQDGEERFKAIGMIDGRLWTAVHVYRGQVVRFLSVRRSNSGEQGIYHGGPG